MHLSEGNFQNLENKDYPSKSSKVHIFSLPLQVVIFNGNSNPLWKFPAVEISQLSVPKTLNPLIGKIGAERIPKGIPLI